jgi:p70 ribosomal S6 kinase
VFLVEHQKSGVRYAMKVLDKQKIFTDGIVKYMLTERDILTKISHPFIVELHYAF